MGQEWMAQQRERLKAEGGTSVLARLRQSQETDAHVSLDESLGYLTKREAMLQYPQFQAQGWPIASGLVESANKRVVEARLKGAGMHWQRDQISNILDRWSRFDRPPPAFSTSWSALEETAAILVSQHQTWDKPFQLAPTNRFYLKRVGDKLTSHLKMLNGR